MLIPEENYRNYQNLEEQNEALIHSLAANPDLTCPDCPCAEANWFHMALWTVVGFAVGAVVLRH